VGDARFFALADAGVLRSETVNYVPQLIAAALVAKEPERHGLRVRELDDLAYDEVRVPALTPLAAVAAATGTSRAELLELNPHLLRGMTPPGGPTVVRVPQGAGEGAAESLAELDADARRAFRRVVTRRRDTWDALADRAGVSVEVIRAYNAQVEVVERGKYRGRLVGNQALRVPTAAVQAYARARSWEGTAPGALPVMPAPPPEPEPKPAAKAGSKRKPRAAAAPDSTAPPADSALHRALREVKDKPEEDAAGSPAKPGRRRNVPDEARRVAPESTAKPAAKASPEPSPKAPAKAPAKSASKAADRPAGKSARPSAQGKSGQAARRGDA
jgi:membrane-bound lytic murein transglycosylase D